MPSYKPVNALLRGLEVLRCVSRMGLATVRALHEETGVDKATIVRMLETLIHAGYVRRDKDEGGYRVAGLVLELSLGFDRLRVAADLAAPVLARFRAEIGWPSDFALRDGDAMIVAETSREPGPMFLNRRPGFRAPILPTSIGRAYLASCPAEERAEIVARLRARPEGGPSDAAIAALLRQVRRAGCAEMDEAYSQAEYAGLTSALAVPVMGGNGRAHGALNVMYLRNAMSADRARRELPPRLRAAASELAAAFRDGGLPAGGEG
ncbi:helix-turn-helix domain-containing protein [Pikeienuella piscinae]|uniref:Helix-turn-helix domain-containing protein n=1 Tax=Pikeienuella piscinae TaxID=2748098 RepID=A0A7L5BW21_9RHOB|nr:helix-turn-helix domain-containing protein [Pikeienuella piscinae]QIE55038.1 helix-turn-helix domain-containing protein [Pikeienuella piscinae]